MIPVAGLVAMSAVAQAQLAPTTDAPLRAHLMEVNKEWRVMDPAPAGAERVVHFRDEADRIATHLHMVAAYERTHAPEGLSAAGLEQRNALLDKLDAYADRGLFPKNHVMPVRNPVFIDPHGTACAVGQLMIESGRSDLAARIQQEMNLAYVHDMKRADVFAWAGENGFTEDELAWIQPGYPPNIPWYTLGDGTNGTVRELLRLQNGDLLVAGDFSVTGGVYASRVARWNGASWSAMGAGVNGDITSAIEFNGDIYLGGSFGSGVSDLARWTGSSWVLSAAFSSKYAYVSDLFTHDGELYAAGSSSGFSGTSYGVKRMVNGDWVSVGQQLNGMVRALDYFDGTLVCAGEFLGDYFESDTSLLHVARLANGTWEQLADGLDGNVRDLLAHQGQLYAAGDCVSEILTRFGMARIATGAGSWEQLMPNVVNYIYSPLDGMVGINAMLPDPDGTRIHLGGDFYASEIMTQGMGLATFHGTPDAVTVLGEFQGTVNDLDLLGTSELVAGGASPNLFNIATTDLTLAVPGVTRTNALSLWPNPAVDVIRIDGLARSTITRVELIDASGRMVRQVNNIAASRSVDVHDLPAGAYTARILANDHMLSATFIKR